MSNPRVHLPSKLTGRTCCITACLSLRTRKQHPTARCRVRVHWSRALTHVYAAQVASEWQKRCIHAEESLQKMFSNVSLLSAAVENKARQVWR